MTSLKTSLRNTEEGTLLKSICQKVTFHQSGCRPILFEIPILEDGKRRSLTVNFQLRSSINVRLTPCIIGFALKVPENGGLGLFWG